MELVSREAWSASHRRPSQEHRAVTAHPVAPPRRFCRATVGSLALRNRSCGSSTSRPLAASSSSAPRSSPSSGRTRRGGTATTSFWSTTIGVDIGSYRFEEDLAHVVNDLLMALFFFVVGMEIKRELVVGELRDRRAVALPAMAALGGMLVPAAIYLAFNASGDGARGWGIPMATDIAFALGVVAILGHRVPPAVKVLLLTLAIVDDIGAIAVIAVFYSDGLRPSLLLAAAAITGWWR